MQIQLLFLLDINQTLYDSIKGDNVYLLGDAIHPSNLMTAIWGAYTIALKV